MGTLADCKLGILLGPSALLFEKMVEKRDNSLRSTCQKPTIEFTGEERESSPPSALKRRRVAIKAAFTVGCGLVSLAMAVELLLVRLPLGLFGNAALRLAPGKGHEHRKENNSFVSRAAHALLYTYAFNQNTLADALSSLVHNPFVHNLARRIEERNALIQEAIDEGNHPAYDPGPALGLSALILKKIAAKRRSRAAEKEERPRSWVTKTAFAASADLATLAIAIEFLLVRLPIGLLAKTAVGIAPEKLFTYEEGGDSTFSRVTYALICSYTFNTQSLISTLPF